MTQQATASDPAAQTTALQPTGPRLVVASSNAGKLREIRALLAGSGWQVLAPSDLALGRVDVVESGRSYLENALLKANSYARVTGLPALADDSGLEVDALDGRPGVHSARYGGATADDADRCARLLAELRGVPPARRTARFRAVVVLALPGGRSFVREGVVEGRIADAPRGTNGFGYDPIFELPDGRTMAELGEEKQRISHRAQAIRAMMDVLKDVDSHDLITTGRSSAHHRAAWQRDAEGGADR